MANKAKRTADSRPPQSKPTVETQPWGRLLVTGFAGALLGLSLIKFGNPVILDRMITPPDNLLEYIFQPWPVVWGYCLLVLLAAASFKLVRIPSSAPKWVLLAPLLWFGWQFLASATSVNKNLSHATVVHFAVCLFWFYLGFFVLGYGPSKGLRPFWAFLLAGFLFVLWTGFEQHYGGLEETRKMFFAQPDWQKYPPEYIERISKNRVFSTLVYPNALAGAVLLLMPSLLWATWTLSDRLTRITRMVLTGATAYASVACLFWSGSKAGWLIALGLGALALLRQPMSRQLRLAIVCGIMVFGLAGFFVRFSGYFKKGATSVSARMDYWTAAAKTAAAHPLLGTGPGTFSISYNKIKPQGAEMAKLTHNDFLEQASDSGFIGFFAYAAFIFGILAFLYRQSLSTKEGSFFWILLGTIGSIAQSFVEFPLYIPALAWTCFAFLGLLVGTACREMASTAKS